MKYQEGYIKTDKEGSKRIYDALKVGAIGFTLLTRVTRYDCFMLPADAIATIIKPPDVVQRYWMSGMVVFGGRHMTCFHFNLLDGRGETFGSDYVNEKLLDSRSPADATDIAPFLNWISELAQKEGRNILV